jgi:Arc/MetJ-type ribon-helix-helix transcriptional regulator
MASVTVGFSIPEEDQERLDRLVAYFAQGNRSAFLRLAMKQMEVLERAGRLRDLQTFGVQQRAAAGLEDVPVEEIVHRVLAKKHSG